MISQSVNSIPCDAVGLQENVSNVMANLCALEIESLRLAGLQEINNNSNVYPNACSYDATYDLNERVGKLERMVDKIINKLISLNYEEMDLSIDEQYGDWV